MSDTTAAPAQTGGKGLSTKSVGLVAAVFIGVSCIAPAYTLSGALGPTASEVGEHLPAILLVGFIPMLLVAVGYRELNKDMPDSGTTFTWGTRAFGPWVGWMGGWGLLAATISEEDLERFWAEIDRNPGVQMTVDLEARTASIGDVQADIGIDDYTRWRLLEGLDDIGLTLRNEDKIAQFEARRESWRPRTLPVQ